MLQLIKFENKKIEHSNVRKLFLICLLLQFFILFVCYNYPFFSEEHVSMHDVQDAYNDMAVHEDWKNYLESKLEKASRTSIFDRKLAALGHIYRHYMEISKMGDEEQRNILPLLSKDSYATKANTLREKKKQEIVPCYIATNNILLVLAFPIPDVMVIVCSLLIGYYLLVEERYSIVGKFAYGVATKKLNFLLAKSFLIVIYVFGFGILLQCAGILEASALSGKGIPFFSPIQALEGFSDSFFYGNVLQFLCWYFILKLCGYLAFLSVALAVWCIPSKYTHGVVTLFVFFLYCALSYITIITEYRSKTCILQLFFLVDYFKGFCLENIFGFPVESILIYICYMLALIIGTFLFMFQLLKRNRRLSQTSLQSAHTRGNRLSYFEAKKLLWESNGILFFLVVLIGICAILYRFTFQDGEEYYYKAYTFEMENKTVLDAASYIKAEKENLENLSGDEVYVNSFLDERMQGLKRAELQIDQLAALQEQSARVLYLTPFQYVFSGTFRLCLVLGGIVAEILVILLDYKNEDEGGILYLFRSRNMDIRPVIYIKNKIVILFISTLELTLATISCIFILFQNHWNFRVFLYSIENIFLYEADMPIWGYILVLLFLRISLFCMIDVLLMKLLYYRGTSYRKR